MPTALRHLLAILALPVVAAIVLPQWLLRRFAGLDSRWPADSLALWPARLLGGLLLLAGVALFLWCVALFARVGRGTLAPWDPTARLVAVGPYDYVRNPMISGVAAALAGQALFLGSWVLASWLILFVAINHIYFLRSEEPGLERRFGVAYAVYKDRVPRWIPRRPVGRGRRSEVGGRS
jgi:protein-S-isoprenylcysteine O-methyltransferase Ste14